MKSRLSSFNSHASDTISVSGEVGSKYDEELDAVRSTYWDISDSNDCRLDVDRIGGSKGF